MESPSTESPAAARSILTLERLDNLAHIVVGAFFLLMAATTLIYTALVFVRQGPIMVAAAHGNISGGPENVNPFFENSLDLLSSVLFVVILLELLRTILTYLRAHDVRATVREFLMVGIISSVRKILLVGAQSSLAGERGASYTQEALGTLISVVAILLLIGALVLLEQTLNRPARASAGKSPDAYAAADQ